MTKRLEKTNGKPRVVVIGCGFGGLSFAEAFRGNAEVLIIDQNNHHLFQPLLYQVAMAGLAVPDVAEPIRTIFAKRRNVGTLMAQVQDVDLNDRVVYTKEMGVEYDYLVLAAGGITSYFGNDEWAKWAPGLKNVEDALTIRRRILTSFEHAESSADPAEVRRLMTIVVVGGGPTGVELAGSMAELSKVVFKRDFRRINPADATVMLIDGGDRLLKAYPEELSAKAKEQLEGLGVQVMLGERVTDVENCCVHLKSGQRIETANVLWGGGINAVPLTQKLGVELGIGGRIKVEPDCSIPGYPDAFAIGDVAHLEQEKDGELVPWVAQGAMQMGEHVAKIIDLDLVQRMNSTRVEDRPAFSYWDKGSMATIGRRRAVAWVKGLKFSGFPAWMLWLLVHLAFLIGFRNRLAVLFSWIYQYAMYKRGSRIIFGVHPDVRDEATPDTVPPAAPEVGDTLRVEPPSEAAVAAGDGEHEDTAAREAAAAGA